MTQPCRRAISLSFALAAAALLPACKSVEVPRVPGITPYRMVIQQGNFISQEMVEQLKPGMTREQVRFVLGTPLVTDIFHADRWDYVYFRETPDGKREQRNLSVVFEKEKLVRVVGDLLPSEGAVRPAGFPPQVKPEAAAKPAAVPAAVPAPVPTTPPAPPAAAPPAAEPVPVAQEEAAKPAEEPRQRGFFGRMLEKIGL